MFAWLAPAGLDPLRRDLKQEPMLNQWRHVPLYVTARGLTTSVMPCRHGRSFVIDFDIIDQVLRIDGCDGEKAKTAIGSSCSKWS